MLECLESANRYIVNKIPKYDELLTSLEEYALCHNVPIVTKEVAEFLKFTAQRNNSSSILEIGTAIGYSGIILGRIAEKYNGTLTTIEIDEETYNIASKNFELSGLKNVNLILGDALNEIGKLNNKFDFIFIDAAKGQYKTFFEESYKLLNEGGIIVIDNILFRGYVYAEEYPKKYSTIVRKLNDFIDYLYINYSFILLPFGDGIGIVEKK